MSEADIVRMANQIAAFFAAYDDAEAVEGVAAHVNQFWEPRMRRELAALAATDAADRLDPLVRRALPAIRVPSGETTGGA